MRKNHNEFLKHLDLTHAQSDILKYLFCSKNDVIQKDIEKNFSLKNPTVNGILNRLETKGFITREKSNIDSRTRIIKLTNKSINLKKSIELRRNDLKNQMLDNLTLEEIKTLENIMKKLLNNIKKGEKSERNI